jgi:hypothetical protein
MKKENKKLERKNEIKKNKIKMSEKKKKKLTKPLFIQQIMCYRFSLAIFHQHLKAHTLTTIAPNL